MVKCRSSTSSVGVETASSLEVVNPHSLRNGVVSDSSSDIGSQSASQATLTNSSNYSGSPTTVSTSTGSRMTRSRAATTNNSVSFEQKVQSLLHCYCFLARVLKTLTMISFCWECRLT